MKKVILNLGTGTLLKGCENVIGEILDGEAIYPSRFTGQLPAIPALAALQQEWQQLYALRNRDQALRIHLLDVEGFRYSESTFSQVCQDVVTQFNSWLNSDEFRPVEQRLRTELERTDDVQLILETNDAQIKRLPWHLWQLCQDYPGVELTFGDSNWRPLRLLPARTQKTRVLATFGNGNGLDLQSDLASLNRLPNAALTVLESPEFNQLHDSLWQSEGWDVFFFAGHSQTQDDKGIIDLNDAQRLTIDQIKHALGKAIDNGLKIAIFNSCDGLGLAEQLSELQIPYVVVMREPVPDHIAQQFLHYLLTAFASGLPFHLAVKEARQRLAGLDGEIPCASWLPVIWQNPTAVPIYWQDLQRVDAPAVSPTRKWLTPLSKGVWKGVLTAGAVMGIRLLGLLEPLELMAYDRLMQQRSAEPVDSRIVVIEIAEEATSDYGYPLPDETLATLIDRVNQANPLAIGLDLHRPNALTEVARTVAVAPSSQVSSFQADSSQVSQETQQETDASATNNPRAVSGYDRFLQQIEDNPHLFVVCAYSSTDENYRAPVQLSEALRVSQVGFSDVPTDIFRLRNVQARSDLTPQGSAGVIGNKVRRQLLSYDPEFSPVPSTCITPYSFSFQLAFQYLAENGISPIEVTEDQYWRFGSVELTSLTSRFGGYQKLQGSNDQILLNYRANQPARKLTLEQVLSNNFEPGVLKDRVVMIGYTAPVSKDYFETPYGPMAGLWVHAHMVSQLMSAVLDKRPLIGTLPQWDSWQWGDVVWVLSWSGVFAFVGWYVRRRLVWLGVMLCGVGGLYVICWWALMSGLWLPLVPTALAMGVSGSWARLSRRSQVQLSN